MAIGAEDYIDQLLVDKYAQEKVDNHENMVSMVKAEDMMNAMNNYSLLSRNMFVINKNISSTCNALNSLNIKYRSLSMAQNRQSIAA